MTALGTLVVALGALLLVIAAWGVLVLPDTLSRQHAATKAGTLAVAVILLGTFLLMPRWEWAWRLALMAGFLLATLPVSSHLLARAAVAEAASGERGGGEASHETGTDANANSPGEDPVTVLRRSLPRR